MKIITLISTFCVALSTSLTILTRDLFSISMTTVIGILFIGHCYARYVEEK